MDSFTSDLNIQLTEAVYSVLPIVDELFRSRNSVDQMREEKYGKGINNDPKSTKVLGTKVEAALRETPNAD